MKRGRKGAGGVWEKGREMTCSETGRDVKGRREGVTRKVEE